MFQRFHEKRENEKGFTLIELLVVILIIAILAAIAIPVFLSQREKGWQSQLESALKNGATAAESYATGPGDGSFENLTLAAMRTEGYKEAPEVEDITPTVTADGNSFSLSATHERLGADQEMAVSSADSEPTVSTCNAGVKAAIPAP